MAKIILSPLLLALFVMLVFSLIILLRSDKKSAAGSRKKLLIFLVFVSALSLWLVSTPVISLRIAAVLEEPFRDASLIIPDREVEVVTVLSGGIQEGPVSELDTPGDASAHRVIRGVNYFLNSEADYLVMQGALSGEKPERMTELMKELALKMGVSEEDILLESYSRNTREHPRELLEMAEVSSDIKLAVVTSGWHLLRAEREFARYFADLTLVPAEFISHDRPEGFKAWLPQVSGLRTSTRSFHEMIGIIWYHLRYRLNL